ncbi:MAG: Ig domain-containing protein, partial [Blastocatellia bacterium]
MNKRKKRFFTLPPLLVLFALLLWTAGVPSAFSRKIEALEVEKGSAPSARERAGERQATATAQEAMTVSVPTTLSWSQISQTAAPGPLQAGRAGAEIESDIDPATMRALKSQPYVAPAASHPSLKVQPDPATSKSGVSDSPLAANLFVDFESIDDGDQLDGFLHRPPDCAMAAGPSHVVAAVNSMFVIYTKAGVNVGQASYAGFFSSVCTGCNPFDPRIVYDPVAGRWLLLVINGTNATPGVSNYLLAVSQTSNPTGLWWLYSLSGVLTYPPTGENTWADFPQLGFDGVPAASGGAVYITSNQFTFTASPSFRTAMLNILPKSSLYAGGAISYWRAWDRLNSDGSQAFTLSTALMYGNNGGTYLSNTRNAGSFVTLWRVVPTFPPTPVNWTLQSTQAIGSYGIPPDASQPGGCALMATNDNRISSETTWRNNRLYAAFSEAFDWGGGGGTVSALRYVQINTSSNTTEFNVRFGADGSHYFFPAITTDSSENIVLVFARASSSEFGSIRHTGRLASETTLQGSALLKAGALCITGGRWGDYFSASIDPADGGKVWIYGAWAADVPGVPLPWDWGTWIGQVGFGTPPCPTITVSPSDPNLPPGRAGDSYSQTFTGSGGTSPYSFTISAGLLPGGLTLSSAGVLSGTPTAFGTFNFTVKATDSNGCMGTRAYTLVINPPCPAITVNPSSLPNGVVGVGYNQTVSATGGTPPYTFTIISGGLPAGLTLSPAGVISGTPSSGGTFGFTIKATDANGCMGTRGYSVTITGMTAGLQFYPLARPVRLLDTRAGQTGCDAPGAQIAGGTSRTQTAAGRTCDGLLIPAAARAITGNITTVQSGGGYLTLYPSDAAQPTVANSNYNPNEILNNVFTVGLGAGDGAFKIFVTTNTDIVVDVTGYFAPPGAGGLYFHPLPRPVRLLETRAGFAGCYAPGAPLPGNTDSMQQATGGCAGLTIPAAARAIVGNATTVNPVGTGYQFFTLFPADATRPLAASSNYLPGQIMNAPFTVGLSSGGAFKIYPTTQTELVIDVSGYYSG